MPRVLPVAAPAGVELADGPEIGDGPRIETGPSPVIADYDGHVPRVPPAHDPPGVEPKDPADLARITSDVIGPIEQAGGHVVGIAGTEVWVWHYIDIAGGDGRVVPVRSVLRVHGGGRRHAGEQDTDGHPRPHIDRGDQSRDRDGNGHGRNPGGRGQAAPLLPDRWQAARVQVTPARRGNHGLDCGRVTGVPTTIDLSGKVALVTGASKGIGAAIAKILAESGASVMLSSRKIEALEEMAATIKGDTAVHAAHAGRPEEAQACVAATIERFGGLDILVNNAATNPYYGRAIDIDLPRFDKTIEVNLRGPLIWTQEAWRQSMETNGGVVLNISSIGGLQYAGPIGIYDLTKAGLIHLTKHLSSELGPGVRVNAIAPGLVKTDFARALWEPGGEDAPRPWPLRRIGQPEDIANAALYLCSDLSSWVTGEVLVVDGGNLVL